MNLIHGIEAEVGKKMEQYNYRKITDSLEVTKVSYVIHHISCRLYLAQFDQIPSIPAASPWCLGSSSFGYIRKV